MVKLTSAQIESYRENGFLLLRAGEHNLVKPEQLKKWTDEVANWPRVKGKWMPYDEININGQKQLMRTEKFADYHENFRELLFGEEIADLLKQLSGDVSKPLVHVSEAKS
jgi:2-aminoethylphosphonate dioxygenase